MIIITWEEFVEACTTLAKMLDGANVWGVPRGGAIVAGILSYRGCRFQHLQQFASIIVDDIADSGETLKRYKAKDLRTACLFVRYNCDPVPDVFVTILDTDDYVLMPYEDQHEIEERLSKGGSFRNGDSC